MLLYALIRLGGDHLGLVAEKGGVGKSSLAINVAVLADADVKTCLIDLDPARNRGRLV